MFHKCCSDNLKHLPQHYSCCILVNKFVLNPKGQTHLIAIMFKLSSPKLCRFWTSQVIVKLNCRKAGSMEKVNALSWSSFWFRCIWKALWDNPVELFAVLNKYETRVTVPHMRRYTVLLKCALKFPFVLNNKAQIIKVEFTNYSVC